MRQKCCKLFEFNCVSIKAITIFCKKFHIFNLLYTLTIVQLLLFIQKIDALNCYDSHSLEPDRTKECGENELCYSEYYSLRASDHLLVAEQRRHRMHHSRQSNNARNTSKRLPKIAMAHFYDRFCVHEKHCVNRGLVPDGNCLSAYELDSVVQQTFWIKLRAERLEPRRLMFSRFCCCSDNLCNDIRPSTISTIFNFSEPAPLPHQNFDMKNGDTSIPERPVKKISRLKSLHATSRRSQNEAQKFDKKLLLESAFSSVRTIQQIKLSKLFLISALILYFILC